MRKWLLPTLSEVLAKGSVNAIGERNAGENGTQRLNSRMAQKRVKAEREWFGAIAALEELLLEQIDTSQAKEDTPSPLNGLILAGPVPVFCHPSVISHFQTGIFTAELLHTLALMPCQVLPSTQGDRGTLANATLKLPLPASDPLATEQFCLVLTRELSLVLVLGEDLTGAPQFEFSFDPEDIKLAWRSLRGRILLTCPHHVHDLDTLVENFAPIAPDYRSVMQFTRQLLKHLPEEARGKEADRESVKHIEVASPDSQILNSQSKDVELLQALTHEIRTPLTTIRTLTRLLLKRQNLPPDVTKRLEIIDRECTEQINRMELIFRAAELATCELNQGALNLTTISLDQLLEESIPHWQKQAQRRNSTLDVDLPQKLPAVISNPAILDQVLSGLIETYTRNVPAGTHIRVEVTPVGNQLKLQLQSQPHSDQTGSAKVRCYTQQTSKSIGQMLIFQPETGSLTLNLNVTKNMFQALGGKLIVRQKEQNGEVLTIFLPLEVSRTRATKD